jgi:hypothetical protein
MKKLNTVILGILISAMVAGPVPVFSATTAVQIEFLLSQVRSATGSLAGGHVHFYSAGTSTNKAVYLDINKASAAANPYTLDANGTALLYGDGTYRVVIQTAAGVTVYDRDNLKFEDLATDFINAEYTMNLKPKSLTGNDSGNITGYDNITAATRVRAPSIGSLSYTDNGYFNKITYNTGPDEVINVKSPIYGAKCDNVTDDTVALAAALVAARGKTLLIPNGICTTTAELLYDAETYGPISILGFGPNSVLQATGTSNKVLNITGTHGVTRNSVVIKDLSIQSATFGTSAAGLHLDGISDFLVSGVWFDGKGKMTDCLKFTGSQQGQVSGGKALNCTNGGYLEQYNDVSSNGIDWHGMTFSNDNTNLWISNNGTGSYPGGVDDIFFHSNHLTSALIQIDAYGTGIGSMNFISNHLEPVLNTKKGVVLRSGQANVSYNTIITPAGGTEIEVKNGMTGARIIGNIFNADVVIDNGAQYTYLLFNRIGGTITDNGTYTTRLGNTDGNWLNYFGITGNLQVKGDLVAVGGNSRGLVLSNYADNVTKRIRLNDAGDGLVFDTYTGPVW